MSYESINKISELTGVDRRTVKKRIKDLKPVCEGRAFTYDTVLALPLIFGIDGAGTDVLNSIKERARLDKMRADKIEIEIEVAQGKLISLDQIYESWIRVATNVKTRLLTIPTKVAPLVMGCKNIPQVKDILDTQICDVLTELSNTPPGAPDVAITKKKK